MRVIYDPLDTIHWMLDDARAAAEAELVVGETGRARKKPKAQRELERVRYDVLREVLWNIGGRPGPLEEVVDEALIAA